MEKIKLLLLEDLSTDAEIVLRTLEQSGLDFQAVIARNRNEFISSIEQHLFDVILADNTLPQFSASEAIEITKERNIITPFILVTGSISEEYAVNIMKMGACDYILKDRLYRLPNAVLSAIHNFRLDKERKQHLQRIIDNESLMKEAAEIAHFGSWEVDVYNELERWSDENFRILDYDPATTRPSMSNFLLRVHKDDRKIIDQTIKDTIRFFDRKKFNCRISREDGSIRHITSELVVKRDETGNVIRINGFIWDITEAKEAEIKEQQIAADLIQRNKDLEQFAYIISHNLRAPVANIVGLSNLLAEDDFTETDKNMFLKEVVVSVNKVDDIIRDLNHILQVKHQSNDNKETVVFSTLVEDIKAILGEYLRNKDVHIACDFEAVGEMRTLKSYLHSIFYNLISNSIKFRQAGNPTHISIKSELTDNRLILTFKDNGIGIDLERHKDKLFVLYKRFHADRAEGKGMGLYMVKSQVDTLGGQIFVNSRINEGTEFRLVFEV